MKSPASIVNTDREKGSVHLNILVDKLTDKSKEAFIMAIEVYNKPSIKYRVEGFSFLYAMPGNLC